jgi:hypothetical protein
MSSGQENLVAVDFSRKIRQVSAKPVGSPVERKYQPESSENNEITPHLDVESVYVPFVVKTFAAEEAETINWTKEIVPDYYSLSEDTIASAEDPPYPEPGIESKTGEGQFFEGQDFYPMEDSHFERKSILPDVTNSEVTPSTLDNDKRSKEEEATEADMTKEVEYYIKALEATLETNSRLISGIQSQIDSISSHLNTYTAVILGVVAIGFSVIFFVSQSQFAAMGDRIEASKVETAARYEVISTKLEAINQRFDSQKDYIDAKTEKK